MADASSEWVRVTDRLPQDGAECWISNGSWVSLAFRDSKCAGGWTNTDTWEDFAREVTHWMPAVKPPPPPT